MWPKLMELSKINVMEGEWTDEHYYKSLLPLIQDADIPSVRCEVLPITRLHDETYWGGLRSIHRIDIAMLDPRQWYLDDDDFYAYIREVSRIKFSAISLFEHPYGLDRPRLIDLDSFERKLFERTKIAVQIIRGKQGSDIQIISPAITDTNVEYHDRYVDYFMHHRNSFDVYALHLCNDMQEPTIGRVVGLLNQILRILPREVWVTKWAIPSVDHKVSTSGIVGETSWQPLSQAAASQRLRHTFTVTEAATKRKCQWFYSGMCQDAYSPRHVPSPVDFWGKSMVYDVDAYNYEWGFQHFLGMFDYQNNIKDGLFGTFIDLAKMQNSQND